MYYITHIITVPIISCRNNKKGGFVYTNKIAPVIICTEVYINFDTQIKILTLYVLTSVRVHTALQLELLNECPGIFKVLRF